MEVLRDLLIFLVLVAARLVMLRLLARSRWPSTAPTPPTS